MKYLTGARLHMTNKAPDQHVHVYPQFEQDLCKKKTNKKKQKKKQKKKNKKTTNNKQKKNNKKQKTKQKTKQKKKKKKQKKHVRPFCLAPAHYSTGPACDVFFS